MSVAIEESWKEKLSEEFEKQYFKDLIQFLKDEKSQNTVFYPKGNEIFKAFELTPFDEVKVIILGQDPYHGPGQAHGLCFSVPDGVTPPPSLVNIFKEISSDLEIEKPQTGNLTTWAKQGVLLLNATLTVRANQAGSHQGKGWEIFTDSVIKTLSNEKDNLVFLLWGNYAQNKASLIDSAKHLILKAVHPSPLSAHRGFLGCKHFSQTNNWLFSKNLNKIDWNIIS